MIPVRNLPEHVHGALKSRAAREGMSLSDFLNRELAQVAERPSMQEWLAGTAQIKPLRTTRSAASIIPETRDSR